MGPYDLADIQKCKKVSELMPKDSDLTLEEAMEMTFDILKPTCEQKLVERFRRNLTSV